MKKSVVSVFALATLLPALSLADAGAGHFYWTGAVDNDYTNPENWRWSSNASATLPATVPTVMPGLQDYNGNYNVHVHFPGDAANKSIVVANNPKWNSEPKVQKLYFEDATGYVFSGVAFSGIDEIRATGTGTIATFTFGFQVNTSTFSVSSGAELVFNTSIYLSGENTLTVTGGGSVVMKNTMTGWSGDRAVTIQGDSTYRVENAVFFSGPEGKHIALHSAGAKLQYKNSIADAESRFGKSATKANGILNTFDTVNYELAATDMGDGYVEVSLRYLGMPEVADAAIVRDTNGAMAASATLGAVSGTLIAIADDGVNAPVATTLGTDVEGGTTVTNTLSGLSSDTVYKLFVAAENSVGAVTNAVGIFYNGVPQLAAVSAAKELGLVPGSGSVSIGTASAFPITIALLYAGADGAVEGQTFETPVSSVTIPAGSTSAMFDIVPMTDDLVTSDASVTVSLGDGDYLLAPASTASIVLLNAALPQDKNVWIAGADSDGLASTAENWSQGVPTTLSDILVDGTFSNVSMTWDAGVNGLPPTVSSWTQQNYTGTNTFPTVYDGDFAVFTVIGDCTINAGVWTHPANAATQEYRLNVAIGGDFTLGASASFDLYRKGYASGKFPVGGAKGVHGGGHHSLACTYGSITQPVDLGAGGDSYAGGGAVQLIVAGDATVNGAIQAYGGKNDNVWGAMSCGAGGSVYLRAASVSGTGAIDVSAPAASAADGQTPTGGRIAIELTEASSLGLPVANLSASGTIARGMGSSGAGTILVKTADQQYGTLYVKNVIRGESGTYGLTLPGLYGTTLIPAGATWTLDGIVFSDAGILAVPEGTTLCLPGGFRTITGSSKRAGILALGGTIDAGDEDPYLLQGNWVFAAETPYTFDRDVVVSNSAALGTLRLFCRTTDIRRSTIAVEGDLTIDATGFLYASGAGLTDAGQGNPRFGGLFSYGGMPGIYGTDASAVYGSILHPDSPGTFGNFNDSAAQYPGGGVLKLTVSGALAFDGRALSHACLEDTYSAGGTGGSLDITAATLTGTGSVEANGHSCQQNASKIDTLAKLGNSGAISCGGGGRIAIRLTQSGATFPEGFADRVTAYGGSYTFGGNHNLDTGTNTTASAGTVYLQDGTADEGAGIVYVKNNNRDFITAKTPFPSLKEGGENDNLHAATLDVSGRSHVAISRALRLRGLDIAENSTVDLCGRVLTVTRATLGGVKLGPGAYASGDERLGAYVADSSENGTGVLVVAGEGTTIILR